MINNISPRGLRDCRDRLVLVLKPDGERRILPGIVEHVAPIGRVDEVDTEPFGRFAKRPRLISRRRR